MSRLFGAALESHEGDGLLLAAETSGLERELAVSLTFQGDMGRVLNRDGASVPLFGSRNSEGLFSLIEITDGDTGDVSFTLLTGEREDSDCESVCAI